MTLRNGQARWTHLVYSGLIYPLLRPQSYRGLRNRLRYYQRLESLSLEENRKLQWQALTRLLRHAYETSPFYRERLDSAGVEPSEITSPTHLEKVPPLTRDDIRERLDDLWSRRFQRHELQRSVTGGTTSTPVPFLRSMDSVRQKIAVQLRLNCWADWQPGDKTFYLWGAQADFPEHPSWRGRLYSRYVWREVYTSTSLLNDERMEFRRKALNSFRPHIICAFPTPLTLFCQYLRQSQHPYHRPRSVICSAEPLLPHQRELVEEVMGCPVFDHYGSREFGMIAAECERHEGLHVNPAAAYLEFLPVEGAEIEGLHEILVTDLLNYGMPLIRYKVNDCVLLGPETCDCGLGYPLIGRIVGRTSDLFHLPNGDKVPGVSLIRVAINLCAGIRKMQIVQDTLHDFRLRFVPGPTYTPADRRQLRSRLDERFGSSIHWAFERVEEIERERSGKTRMCISHVSGRSASGKLDTRVKT